MFLSQACETACITSSDWEKRFNNATMKFNQLKEENKLLENKSASLQSELDSAKLRISSLELANKQLSNSQSGVVDLKNQVGRLQSDLTHRTERCKLYKRELGITIKNYGYHLEKYRDELYENFIAKYKVPRSAFPDLDGPKRTLIPSLLTADGDYEDSSADEEYETGSEEDEEKTGSQGDE